jgi:hypothetical protein
VIKISILNKNDQLLGPVELKFAAGIGIFDGN